VNLQYCDWSINETANTVTTQTHICNGEPGEDSLARTFRKKKGYYIWVSFLDPKDIKIYVWGPYGTLVKEQGSPELISDYGA
jgi:hypothetical protein